MHKKHQNNSKITLLNKNHTNTKMNATSFLKQSKPLFYTCKHKYETNKKKQKKSTLSSSKFLF
jgi:hypothetical protein